MQDEAAERVARRLLLTPSGRRLIVALYAVAAVTSVVVYAVARSPVYAAGQVALLGGGALWVRWCLRRP